MKMRLLVTSIISAFIIGITPHALAADTSAPILVDWKLIDLKTDISSGDGVLRVQFSISDESAIESPLSSLSSQSTTQQSGFAFPTLKSKVGNLSTYTAEATISFGKAPGLWRWLLFPLRDSLGNSSLGFGPGGSWPVDVWVYDKDFTEAKRKRMATEAKVAADAKAAAEKAAAEAVLNSYQAKLDTLEKLNSEIEPWLSKYPKIFQANPFLKSGLMKGLDYSSVVSPTQKDVDEIATLIGGDAGWVGVLSLKLETELLLKKYLAEEAAKSKTKSKKTTITCVKGKLTKKVTAVKPKCPSGYKVKK
jgi:hypothetical protein